MIEALLLHNARVLTMAGDGLGAREQCDVLIESGMITGIGPGLRAPSGARIIDARSRVVMPSFVDCHTHLCWAGNRLDEWDRKRRGDAYLEILASGGGIMSTVRAVRQAREEELVSGLTERLGWLIREGTTCVEIKSGYGLSTEHELKMLRSIVQAGEAWDGTVIPTACIGHAIDPEVERDVFIARTLGETLDAVHDEFPGIAVDAYCEEGAWTLEECRALFDRARQLGHPCRVHTDQFNELGMTRHAIEHGFLSVDHLEATSPEVLELLAESDTTGVVLPCSGYHVDGRYAPARALVDHGGRIALATNANPGSAPCLSMPTAIAMGVRGCGLTPAEALIGATRGGASVLGIQGAGKLEVGSRAELVMLRHSDERELAYTFGGRPVLGTVCGKRIIGFDDDDLAG